MVLLNAVTARTPAQMEEAVRSYKEEATREPSMSELLTQFMRTCTDMAGNALLQPNERAVVSGGEIRILKMH